MKLPFKVVLLLLVCSIPAIAQYGNEWIDFNQEYYKIPVARNGLYRITFNSLTAAGFPIESIDPKRIQLYHRGTQQAVYVSGENDGSFNASDFIEFYGVKNDGKPNTELYEDPQYQPHTYYNLFSDTTAYFLTVGSLDGKRVQTILDDVGDVPPETHHWKEIMHVLTDGYSVGQDYGQLFKTSFDKGEGWMGPLIRSDRAASVTTLSGIERQYTSGPKPKIELVMTGRASKTHGVEVSVGSRLLTTREVNGFSTVKIESEIEWSDIVSGAIKVTVKVTGDATRVSIGYIKLYYPQLTDMASQGAEVFILPAGELANLQITNTPSSTRFYEVSDPNNIKRLLVSGIHLPVPSSPETRMVYASSVTESVLLKRIVFRAIAPQQHNYIIISHPVLRRPAGSYSDPVEAYAAYRASEAGGGYDTLLVNINDLYNQFSYGEQTPLAIFRFMKFLSASRVPDFLFIIGKGLDVHLNYHRNPKKFKYNNLVPTAGWPASDIAYTAGLGGSTFEAGVATGRIASKDPHDVAAYLDKVKETESRPYDDLRRKHVLHLSGGVYAGEHQTFRQYLEGFKPLAEDFYFGGSVSAIAKQSTDITLINIADELNKGLALVTFFGHSSPGVLDFDIGNATDKSLGYDNKGKYPMLLMNGCDAGAFFLDAEIFGENWVNAGDSGAIGFIAHTSYGFIHQLREYSRKFYEVAFTDSLFIGKGVGQIQREACRRYLLKTSSAIIDVAHVQQMIMLGDPAVAVFGADQPDFALEDENLSILSMNDEPVTALSDSFAVKFIARNYGVGRNQNIRVEIQRTLNDRSVITYDSIYPAVRYSDTLLFVVRGKPDQGFGNNTFRVFIDADNIVDELNEANNVAYLDFFIPLNSIKNLFPLQYSIVNKKSVTFSFQHSDVSAGEREYILEIDTTKTFVSAYKKSLNIKAKVLARHDFSLLDHDTLVYYWRTKLAKPLINENKNWSTSSFTFIHDGNEGWAQAAFDQMNENVLTGFVKDPPVKKLSFLETKTDVHIRTFGAQSGESVSSIIVKINNKDYHLASTGSACRNNSINLIAFDRTSTVPYLGVPFEWYNVAGRACGVRPWVINNFRASQVVTGNGDDLIAYIDNIHEGDSVILFTIGDARFGEWPEEAIKKTGELGISPEQIQNLIPGEPIVITTKKGAQPGEAKFSKVTTGSPPESVLSTDASVTGRYSSGEIRTPLIGPSTVWKNIFVQTSERDNNDVVTVDVLGVNSNGSETLLFSNIASPLDISSIDTRTYPYLRLQYKTTDDLTLTATQLDNWIVSYKPIAEGIVFYKGSVDKQHLFEGDTWKAEYGFVNVSDTEFSDALPVHTKVFNRTKLEAEIFKSVITAPAPNDTVVFTIEIPTINKQGTNDIDVFVNPMLVPEAYYDNNVFVLRDHLVVAGENFKPVIDVTMDGRYVAKDEFVSSSPVIAIKVWDENQYLLVSDTSALDILLAYPCEMEACEYKRIYFSRDDIKWFPATDSSAFTTIFNPKNLPDGKYILRLEAKDQTGNASGINPYEITFVVNSEHAVIVSQPYPNPAKDRIKFDLTLSGKETSNTFVIQIVDMRGMLVHQLDESYFTNLHIGNNTITWNLSEGISLQPGVYFYKFKTNSSGNIAEHVGKLVIIK